MPFITDPASPRALVSSPFTDPTRSLGPGVVGPPIIPPYQRPIVVTSGTGTIGRANGDTLNNVSRNPFETQLNVSAIDEPIRVIFGEVRVGAAIPRALFYNSLTLMIVCLWGRGEIQGIPTLTMGGEPLPPYSQVDHYTGTQSQTVNTPLAYALSLIGVTWTDALIGMAYTVIRLPAYVVGEQVNLADFHAVIQGLKCYDPRDGTQVYATPTTWKYTDNPTLCLARMLTDDTIGLGMVPNATFWSDVTANANLNDVTLSGGEKTRTLNLALEAQRPAEEWIKVLALYAGCFVVPDGAIYRIIPDAPASSVATYTEADMVDNSFSWSRKDILKRPNIVYVRWTEPVATGNYIPSVAPQGADVPAIPSTEKRRGQIIEMPGLNKYSRANRAWIERRNHLYVENLDMKFTLFDEGLTAQLGDVITVSFGTLFVSKLMRIMGISLTELGRWLISCSEYDPASYSTSVQTAPTYSDSPLVDPLANPPPVTSLVLTEIPATNDSTTAPMSRIHASWVAPSWPYIRGYTVEITDDAATPVVVYPATEQTGAEFTSPPLPSPKKYRVNVKTISNYNAQSVADSNAIFLTQGSNTMFTIFSQALTSSGWSLQGGVSQAGLSFETVNYVAGVPSITTRYGPPPGADEDLIYSPIYDLGQLCTVVLSLDVLKHWIVDSASIGAWIQANVSNPELLSIPGRAFQVYVGCYDDAGNPYGFPTAFDGDTEITARYFRLSFYGPKLYTTDDTLYPPIDYADWKIDLTGGVLTAKMPITAESVSTTTSATVPVTVPLAERYLAVTGIASSGESTAFVNVTTEPPLTGEYLPNSIKVNGFDAAGARIANKAYVTILGVRGRKTLTNWAAAANGGSASATSFVFANTPAKAIDGNLSSAGGNFWYTTIAQPQTLTVDYGTARNVTEIVLIFLNDVPASTGLPTVFDVATLYHATSFTVQEYVAGVWTTISGGTVTGNTKVMRRFPVTNSNATQVRVTITASPDGGSRIAELMAIGPA